MEVETDDLELFQDLVPDDAIGLFGIRLVAYVNADGVTTHEWATAGQSHLGEMVGAIEVLKFNMLYQAMDDDEETE